MKYIMYGFLISLGLFMLTVFLFGCDPVSLPVHVPTTVDIEWDMNCPVQQEHDDWIDSLDPNMVEEVGLS